MAARRADAGHVRNRLVALVERGLRQVDEVLGGVLAENGERRMAEDAVAGRAQRLATLADHRELHIRVGKGELLDRLNTGGRLAASRPEKFAARGKAEEE